MKLMREFGYTTYDMVTATRCIRNNHVRCTSFGVVRMEAFVVDGSDSNREYTVRVAVEVALVPASSAITTGEDENRALSTPTLLDSVDHSLLDEIPRSFHRPAVIGRTPATRVDRSVLIVVVERSGLVDVGDRTREDAYTSDLGIVRDANSTYVVLDGGNLTRATSAMVVIEEDWSRQVGMIVVVVRTIRVLHTCQESAGKPLKYLQSLQRDHR